MHVFREDDEYDTYTLSFEDIRPASVDVVDLADVTVGETVLINFNIVKPGTLGYW